MMEESPLYLSEDGGREDVNKEESIYYILEYILESEARIITAVNISHSFTVISLESVTWVLPERTLVLKGVQQYCLLEGSSEEQNQNLC